jgi:hypothetical protein
MAEEFSLGEALSLQTGLPPQQGGISKGINAALQMELRRDMLEAQRERRDQQLQQGVLNSLKGRGKKYSTPFLAQRESDNVAGLYLSAINGQPDMGKIAEYETQTPVNQAVEYSVKESEKRLKKGFMPKAEKDRFNRFKQTGDVSVFEGSRYFEVDPESQVIINANAQEPINLDYPKMAASIWRASGGQLTDYGQIGGTEKRVIPESTIKEYVNNLIQTDYDVDQIAETKSAEFEKAYNTRKASAPVGTDDNLIKIAAAKDVVAKGFEPYTKKEKPVTTQPDKSLNKTTFYVKDGEWFDGDNKSLGFRVINDFSKDVLTFQNRPYKINKLAIPDMNFTLNGMYINADSIQEENGKLYFIGSRRKENRYEDPLVPFSEELTDSYIASILKGKNMTVKEFKTTVLPKITYKKKSTPPPPPSGNKGGALKPVENLLTKGANPR